MRTTRAHCGRPVPGVSRVWRLSPAQANLADSQSTPLSGFFLVILLLPRIEFGTLCILGRKTLERRPYAQTFPDNTCCSLRCCPTLSRSGFAESGKRQELTVRGIQRTLEQRELADHFAILRRRILEHARTRLEGDAQVSTDGSSYVNIIPYVAADANTRTNLGLNNFSRTH